LPVCDARIVHVPSETSVTVLALMMQVGEVSDVNATGSPEDAVATTTKGGAPSGRLFNAPNVMT
jgi:hypothetical protein